MQTLTIRIICLKVIVWACGNMRRLSPPPPSYFSALVWIMICKKTEICIIKGSKPTTVTSMQLAFPEVYHLSHPGLHGVCAQQKPQQEYSTTNTGTTQHRYMYGSATWNLSCRGYKTVEVMFNNILR